MSKFRKVCFRELIQIAYSPERSHVIVRAACYFVVSLIIFASIGIKHASASDAPEASRFEALDARAESLVLEYSLINPLLPPPGQNANANEKYLDSKIREYGVPLTWRRIAVLHAYEDFRSYVYMLVSKRKTHLMRLTFERYVDSSWFLLNTHVTHEWSQIAPRFFEIRNSASAEPERLVMKTLAQIEDKDIGIQKAILSQLPRSLIPDGSSRLRPENDQELAMQSNKIVGSSGFLTAGLLAARSVSPSWTRIWAQTQSDASHQFWLFEVVKVDGQWAVINLRAAERADFIAQLAPDSFSSIPKADYACSNVATIVGNQIRHLTTKNWRELAAALQPGDWSRMNQTPAGLVSLLERSLATVSMSQSPTLSAIDWPGTCAFYTNLYIEDVLLTQMRWVYVMNLASPDQLSIRHIHLSTISRETFEPRSHSPTWVAPPEFMASIARLESTLSDLDCAKTSSAEGEKFCNLGDDAGLESIAASYGKIQSAHLIGGYSYTERLAGLLFRVIHDEASAFVEVIVDITSGPKGRYLFANVYSHPQILNDRLAIGVETFAQP